MPATHPGVPKRGQIISPVAAPDAIGDFTGNEWFYQVCTQVGFHPIKNTVRAVGDPAATARTPSR